MANEVDELMDNLPSLPTRYQEVMDKALPYSDKDMDTVVAYHRRNRANAEAGVKPKKEAGPKVSLDGLLDTLIKPKVVEPIKRRL